MRKYYLFICILSLSEIAAAQDTLPCAQHIYDRKREVQAMVIDSTFCDCNLCEIQPKTKRSYNLKDVHYCNNGFIGFGVVDTKDADKGKCAVFPATALYSYRNTLFTTVGVSNTAFINNDRLENNLLVSVQVGYYFRDKPIRGYKLKLPQIHPSYSINIKHGVQINSRNTNTFSPFLGVDFSLNAFIRPLNGFISYSAGYTLIHPTNQNKLYFSLGYNFLLL